ncbi:MAG: Ig-like domain-containing protein [Sulfurimicrobium sp.]
MNARAFPFPFLLFLAALFAVSNVFADSESSSSLQVSPASVSMKVGNTVTLAVSNASGSVSAESNDKTVVSASYSSRVVTLKGLKAGSTYVKVKDSKTEQKIPVTVSAATSGGLSVSPASVAMNVGGTASVIVFNASGTVTATSSNTSVATVSYAGGTATVKAIKAGSASITIKDSKTTVAVSVSVVTTPVASTGYTLLAWNDLGMHCAWMAWIFRFSPSCPRTTPCTLS